MQVILSDIKYVYLLGIGGIGMSALARYFKNAGKEVSGYDKTPTSLTDELQQEGIQVHFEDHISNLPSFLSGKEINPYSLVIYTPAIPKELSVYKYISDRGYKLWKRSEVLGMLTASSYTIAVAGTHGKTTTSTMISHILRYSGVDCTAFLGGISKNYNTNLLLGKNEDATVVVEADEFDRSFLTLTPDIAVITSLDADHLDIYGDKESMVDSYRQFATNVKKSGTLIYKSGLELKGTADQTLTYSLDREGDYRAENVRIENHEYVFDIASENGNYKNIIMGWPGRHNVENALAAFTACLLFGTDANKIREALKNFEGVKRRFDYQIRTDKIVLIDDYAHHPEELKAIILSVKELYPGKKVLGIFQPHLFTRTRDFLEGFGQSLSLLDELILLEIYPAREKPLPGVTSELILERARVSKKILCRKSDLTQKVKESSAGVVLTLGAGDIDQLVEPVKKALLDKYSPLPA
jgi:UDP-N-acetylmuramate--alanine ligase